MAAPHPILQSARREAAIVAGLWVAAGTWAVGYCYTHGYGATPDKLQFHAGFSQLDFWGVALPWVVCAVLSLFIANVLMTDADLGVEPGEEEDLFDA